MTPAVTATGVANVTSCQPEAVSAVNMAVASLTPAVDQRFATCSPVFAGPLRSVSR